LDSRGPTTVPLELKNARSGDPVQKAVVLSYVRSTGWFPYIQMESKSHPFDKVRIEGITRLDPKAPAVLMPAHLPGAGFVLGLIINEDPCIMVFSPGYEPAARIDVLLNGQPTRWSYRQSAYEKKAVLQVAAEPLPEPSSATSQAATDRPGRSAGLLADEALWKEIRAWYLWGRAKAEITVICQCVLDEARADVRDNPRPWTPAQQQTLDWCREVVAGK